MQHQEEIERWLVRICREVDFPRVQVNYRSVRQRSISSKQHRIDRQQNRSHLPHILPEVAWETPVNLQDRLLGHLQVCLAEREEPGAVFLKACQFAERISQLACQQMQLLQRLENRVHSNDFTFTAIEQGNLQQAVEETLTSLLKLSAFRGAAFYLLDPFARSLQLKHYVHRNLPPLQRAERPLLEADYDRQALLEGVSVCHRRKGEQLPWLPDQVQTGLCVPVANRSGQLGTLWAYDRRYRMTTTQEKHLLQSLAGQLGALLDQALSSWNSSRHRQLKAELKIASATQPAQTMRLKTVDERFDGYGQCLSQFDVGGDLCELIPISPREIFVIVGDASGNSIPAAMVMTAVRGAVLALLSDGNTPSRGEVSENLRSGSIEPQQVISRLNKMLVQMTASHQFMSCVCGIFDLPKREFRFCNAGHPSPIQLSKGETNYLPSHGLLLGIDEQMRYEQQTISFQAGDLFMFYSDGISEALSRSRRMFRQDGIAHAAQQHQHESAQQIVESVWNRVLMHRDGGGEADDATLLAIKLGLL